jgi:hypothetical protein
MKKLALVLLVAPLALAACGGGPSGSVSIDPLAYVKKAASKTADLTSEHMVLTGKMSVSGRTISIDGNGDYANKPLKGTFELSIAAMGHNIALHEVLDGTTVYVSSPQLLSMLPDGKTWIKADLADLGKSVGMDYSSALSQSPSDMMRQLLAAGTVKSLGTETIDGVETTHYQLTNLDLSKLPMGSKLEQLAPKYGPIDVWIGNADGYVYRESLSLSASVSGKNGSLTMSADFSKFNEDVTVDVPADSDTLDASTILHGMSGSTPPAMPGYHG